MRVRRLGELRAAGDERWLRPALDRLAGRSDDGAPAGFLAADRPSSVARAPVRLDVMRGIADYSGALVLQLPLERATTAIAQRQEASCCDVATRCGGRCGLGSDDTDRLVALAAEAGPARGVYGAKITGSGGTVARLVSDDAEPAVREIAGRHAAKTGRDAEIFAASGPGAEEVGVVTEGGRAGTRN